METEDKVSERINLLMHELCGKPSEFAKATGLTPQNVYDLTSGRKGAPSFISIKKILTAYPQVNERWLLLGEGEMLKSPPLSEAGLKNKFVSGAKADIDPRLLTGDVSPEKRAAFNYPIQNPAPSKESPKSEAKQVLGNLVEQLDRNTSEIEQLRAAVRDIQQQLKS